MINFHIISLFPEAFKSYLNASIIKRASNRELIKIYFYNPRDFTKDARRTVDDKPYGGGPGMVIKAEPILKAVQSIKKSKIKSQKSKVLLFTPRGKQFTQKMARNWSRLYKNLIMVSGHYEGIDERVKKIFRAEEISIGPYITTGGELAAMVVVDAVSRHLPAVLGKKESLEEMREEAGAPVYTRPEVLAWKGKKYRVPKVLFSGNHKKIALWKQKHQKSANKI